MMIFFLKKFSRPSNPPDELAENVSKKNLRRTNYSFIFSAKVQNLAVFSFIYMIRIRCFGPGELNQNYFRAAQYMEKFQYHSKLFLSFLSRIQKNLETQMESAMPRKAQRISETTD